MAGLLGFDSAGLSRNLPRAAVGCRVPQLIKAGSTENRPQRTQYLTSSLCLWPSSCVVSGLLACLAGLLASSPDLQRRAEAAGMVFNPELVARYYGHELMGWWSVSQAGQPD